MRFPVNQILPFAATLTLSLALAACNGGGATTGALASAPRTGPAGDYPVVIGDPFTIGDTTYRPDDQLNYDAVGMAVLDDDPEALGISGAHKTLPLPSYAEVTSLDSGRTILVRLERRGPMRNDTLIGLSPAALAQLGATGETPVRVRRVNPPEVERAALRKDGEVPVRMETPEPLLNVLRRKLAEQSPLGPPPATPPALPDAKLAQIKGPAPASGTVNAQMPQPSKAPTIAPVEPDLAAAPVPQPSATETKTVADIPPAKPEAKPATQAAKPAVAEKPASGDSLVVQVGAFSNEAGARKLAQKLDGKVTHPGKYWLVRLGPFASRGEAGPALEKARAAGYRDARIQRMN
ncbi:SPOR domain-containing protein [Novosphingobium aquimarinum]|uniref:SPOR domain-containing protein n=1 Tax=Novosphingobium aquimarinum TaxID=2682494 RepID=UPI0012EB5E52|nr:SPOR domain-containing protein [Novosphingobium aquimarinum]